jgi:predicted nucleotidyltransferase
MTKDIIEVVKNRLIGRYNPKAIYLFGSYCSCMPDEESDLDILIVVDKFIDSRYKMLVDGYMGLFRLNILKDLLLYNEEEFEKFSQDRSSFCYKNKKKGLRFMPKLNTWLGYAQNDLKATRLIFASEHSSVSTVLYFTQQCDEKALKDYLFAQNYPIGRMHDLIKLVEVCMQFDSEFESIVSHATA